MQIHLGDNIRVNNILTAVCTSVSAGIKPTINTEQKVDQKGDEMFSVLVSCAVDRGFEPQSAQIKDYVNGICVASQH